MIQHQTAPNTLNAALESLGLAIAANDAGASEVAA